MGRTVPTFTNIIDSEIASWSKFRRGLRKQDQEVFEDMFRACRRHLAENFYAMRTIPFESIIVSIALEQAGDKPESLVHDVTLLPRHAPSCSGGKVSPIRSEYGVTEGSGSTPTVSAC